MRLDEADYISIEKELIKCFYEVYFKPLLELFKEPLYNSSEDVVNAIRRGQIIIKGNVISGKFNIKLSKELSKFATFDKKQKNWKITKELPSLYKAESINAESKANALKNKIATTVEDISNNSAEQIKKFNFDISKSDLKFEEALKKEYYKLGIDYMPNERIKEQMIKNYNQNMHLNIVNESDPTQSWDYKQVNRLRQMITEYSLEGFNHKKMVDRIQAEFDISARKAKFLARQETSIYMATLRDVRYQDSNVKLAMWMTSNDNHVRTSEHDNHKIMAHKICRLDDPTVYADDLESALRNEWKSRKMIGAPLDPAGIPYNCRCTYRPIITKH